MNKTAHTELHRLFLIERLPEPLTPASAHIQIFDNYFANTRIRLRNVRDPASNQWTHILQQRFDAAEGTHAITKLAEMYLDEAEYAIFERYEGREIRKNRYFHEFDGLMYSFDVYLGKLWGLNAARVDLATLEQMADLEPPAFAVFEVTNDEFFDGKSLVEKTFDDVQAEVARLELMRPTAFQMNAE